MAAKQDSLMPWYRRLPDATFRQLFPNGERDVQEFLAEISDLEAAGYPLKCTDPETLLQLAQICRTA
jgi:hypothetical protein